MDFVVVLKLLAISQRESPLLTVYSRILPLSFTVYFLGLFLAELLQPFVGIFSFQPALIKLLFLRLFLRIIALTDDLYFEAITESDSPDFTL